MKNILTYLDQTFLNEELKTHIFRTLEYKTGRSFEEKINVDKQLIEHINFEQIVVELQKALNDTKNFDEYAIETTNYFFAIPLDKKYGKKFSLPAMFDKDSYERVAKGYILGLLIAKVAESAKSNKEKARIFAIIRSFMTNNTGIPTNEYLATSDWLFNTLKDFRKNIKMEDVDSLLKDHVIYLAGPINGCTDEECKTWRELVKSLVGEEKTLDPMRRDYRGREMDCVEEIVEGDKKDIDDSTHVLVSFDKPSVGTSMEILYAWERKTPVIVVAAPDTKLSPWLVYHSEKVFHSYKEATDYILNN